MVRKKLFLSLLILFVFFEISWAENFTIYSGTTSNEIGLIGVTLGGDVLDFLNMNIDVFKYLKKDQSLYSGIPSESRADFLGASINFNLRFPIHFIPYLDRLDFIQPYLLVGYGYGTESFASEYFQIEDKNGRSGIFSKLRQFDSFGYGIIIMLTKTAGIKVDFRSIKISDHEGMGFPGRRFSRFSLGLCFGKN